MRKQQGFNLVELMITVAVLGLIAAFAYPSYVDNILDSRRAECSGALSALANAMERHYSVNGDYLGAAAGGADTGAPAIFSTTCPADGNAATYNLTIAAATTSTYSLRATPVGQQTGDECGSLTLTNTGVKGVVGADTGITWQNCWR
jgi:type IV pilus assembly protein PilE